MTAASTIQQMFKQLEAAYIRFRAGDAAPVMALWSHANDVTLFGGSGPYAQGWAVVGPGIARAAARFGGGGGTMEPLTMGESGDLAYTIYIERGEMRVGGSDEVRPIALRVTQIYRREEGDWKIIHRHADPLGQESTPFSQ